MGKNIVLWEERNENITFLTGPNMIPKKWKISGS